MGLFEPRLAIDVRCEVGEGIIWHPLRGSLLWIDVLRQTLYEAAPDGGAITTYGFGEAVSAVAWIDRDSVAVATASGIRALNLNSGARGALAPLEADRPETRSNDSRTDRYGSFWVSTMGQPIAEGAGSLYRFQDSTFTLLKTGLTSPNSICFSPDGRRAYFSDTFGHHLFAFDLDPENGAPLGEAKLFYDFSSDGLHPDGSVVDSEGGIWSAHWSGGCVTRLTANGTLERRIDLPVSLVTCPAFCGPELKTLYVTTANIDLDQATREREPLAGAIFAIDLEVPGRAEPALANFP
ncbi:MAG: SMP-30/gluconolactonase/LRE family protein [Pseudomonadota bacterium]